MTEILHVSTRYEIQPLTYWPEQQQKDVFHQVEFVDKNNLEAQTPRRDASIFSASAGLGKASFSMLNTLQTPKMLQISSGGIYCEKAVYH